MKILKYFALSILFIGLMSSCGDQKNDDSDDESDKLQVLSSFSIITDMVHEIGKDSVDVHNLVPVGMAPHDYDSKPNDVKFATKADLLIYNGLNLEGGDAGWIMKLARSAGIDESKIYEASERIQPKMLKDAKGNTEVNPHAFINPKAGIAMAEKIGKALAEADKDNRDFYIKNTRAYVEQLKTMDQKYRDKLEGLPEKDKVFMASEQAFQYLLDTYGLKGGYIWAVDTDKNGTPDQIKRAISFVEENNPPVLFVESNVDRRPMKKVSEATGVPIYKKPVYSDELGKPGETADTYLKYLKYNLMVISRGLENNRS